MGQLWGVARQLWGTVSSYGPAVGRGGALFPPPQDGGATSGAAVPEMEAWRRAAMSALVTT